MKAFFCNESDVVQFIWSRLDDYYALGADGILHLHVRCVLPQLGQTGAVTVEQVDGFHGNLNNER